MLVGGRVVSHLAQPPKAAAARGGCLAAGSQGIDLTAPPLVVHDMAGPGPGAPPVCCNGAGGGAGGALAQSGGGHVAPL